MRLIDADALEDRIRQEPTDGMYTAEILEAIDEVPTVDAAPVVHGRWGGRYNAHCSVCQHFDTMAYIKKYPNYCPNCGAKMDKEDG